MASVGAQCGHSPLRLIVALPWKASPALPEWEHDHGRTDLDAIIKVDGVVISHADATRRHRLSDIFRLVGPVDSVERILIALVQIKRARAERIGWSAGNAFRERSKTSLLSGGGHPVRPFRLSGNGRGARECHCLFANRHAVA